MVNRKKISKKIETDVMYASDRQCCVCDKRGDHIHHIDGNNSNNNFDNLALLCFHCHDEATITNSLRKKLSADLIIKYRNHKYDVVDTRRANAKTLFSTSIEGLTTEDLLTINKNAIIALKLEDIKQEYFSVGWDKKVEVLEKLKKYFDHTNFRIAVDFFSFFSLAAGETRYGMTSDVASSILHNITSLFPYSDKDEDNSKKLFELGRECIDIAFDICYESIFYLKNYDNVMSGLTILKFVYRKAKQFDLEMLMDKVNNKYDELESLLQFNDLVDAHDLVKIFRKEIETGTLAFPPLPTHLMKLVYPDKKWVQNRFDISKKQPVQKWHKFIMTSIF